MDEAGQERRAGHGVGEHVERNRAAWNEWAAEFVALGECAWASDVPSWGLWSVPEAELRVLPDDLQGKDAIEFGCGTAYVSAWLARRGARPVGVDISSAQLATARRLQGEHGLDFPLVEANAERVPFPDGASTSSSASTGHVCGPTRTFGCRKRPDCCAPAAVSSS